MALWPQDFLRSFTAQFAAGISRGLTKADIAQADNMPASKAKTTTKTRKT